MPGGQMNWRRVRGEDMLRPRLADHVTPVPKGRGCWCGQPLNHDWTGKNDGAPHPRD